MPHKAFKYAASLAICTIAFSACQTHAPINQNYSDNFIFSSSARVFIAGDSTAADYPPQRAPQIGWGQTLTYFVTDPARILNRSVNGRSTRSFVDEGKWDSLIEELRSGDIVLISFGHNDSRDDAPERYAAADTDYREYLIRFANDVQAKGGYPVIVSSAARRLWEGPAMVETHGLYRVNAQAAAQDSGAEYIDLAQKSLTYFENIGREETKRDFLWLAPNPNHARFAKGAEDNTHFSELGACGVSYILAQEFLERPVLKDLISTKKVGEQNVMKGRSRPAAVISCKDWIIDRR